jgi:selenocysteine lyase/cysteine desulfurase
VPNVYAAAPGFQLLQDIGMENIRTHIRNLTQALLHDAHHLGIAVKTPTDTAGPLLVLQSKDSTRLLGKLADAGIVASNRYDGLRISFHVYNTMEDVAAVVDVLGKNPDLMASAPATVPSHA